VQPVTPLLRRGATGLRIAVAGGYFKPRGAETLQAIDRVAVALGVERDIDIPQAERARSAAFLITASEGASLHLDRLRSRARDYDPAVRDRLIAGAMLPASLVVKAHKFRRWYREEMLKLFAGVDAILAPATPCAAPLIGQQTFIFGDRSCRYGRTLAFIPSQFPLSGSQSSPCRFRFRRCRSRFKSLPRPGAKI
jgi:aspartyl-tRNA(Asn)/glutamyl-tRNA(Gln) amidotransferase subunit A